MMEINIPLSEGCEMIRRRVDEFARWYTAQSKKNPRHYSTLPSEDDWINEFAAWASSDLRELNTYLGEYGLDEGSVTDRLNALRSLD